MDIGTLTQKMSFMTPQLMQPDSTRLPGQVLSLYEDAYAFLAEAESAMQESLYTEVIQSCMKFLERFQFGVPSAKEHYHLMASAFLSDHHTFDSIMSLRSLMENMHAYCHSYFYRQSRKGASVEPPVATPGDAEMIFSFCAGFYNLILGRVQRIN